MKTKQSKQHDDEDEQIALYRHWQKIASETGNSIKTIIKSLRALLATTPSKRTREEFECTDFALSRALSLQPIDVLLKQIEKTTSSLQDAYLNNDWGKEKKTRKLQELKHLLNRLHFALQQHPSNKLIAARKPLLSNFIPPLNRIQALGRPAPRAEGRDTRLEDSLIRAEPTLSHLYNKSDEDQIQLLSIALLRAMNNERDFALKPKALRIKTTGLMALVLSSIYVFDKLTIGPDENPVFFVDSLPYAIGLIGAICLFNQLDRIKFKRECKREIEPFEDTVRHTLAEEHTFANFIPLRSVEAQAFEEKLKNRRKTVPRRPPQESQRKTLNQQHRAIQAQKNRDTIAREYENRYNLSQEKLLRAETNRNSIIVAKQAFHLKRCQRHTNAKNNRRKFLNQKKSQLYYLRNKLEQARNERAKAQTTKQAIRSNYRRTILARKNVIGELKAINRDKRKAEAAVKERETACKTVDDCIDKKNQTRFSHLPPIPAHKLAQATAKTTVKPIGAEARSQASQTSKSPTDLLQELEAQLNNSSDQKKTPLVTIQKLQLPEQTSPQFSVMIEHCSLQTVIGKLTELTEDIGYPLRILQSNEHVIKLQVTFPAELHDNPIHICFEDKTEHSRPSTPSPTSVAHIPQRNRKRANGELMSFYKQLSSSPPLAYLHNKLGSWLKENNTSVIKHGGSHLLKLYGQHCGLDTANITVRDIDITISIPGNNIGNLLRASNDIRQKLGQSMITIAQLDLQHQNFQFSFDYHGHQIEILIKQVNDNPGALHFPIENLALHLTQGGWIINEKGLSTLESKQDSLKSYARSLLSECFCCTAPMPRNSAFFHPAEWTRPQNIAAILKRLDATLPLIGPTQKPPLRIAIQQAYADKLREALSPMYQPGAKYMETPIVENVFLPY